MKKKLLFFMAISIMLLPITTSAENYKTLYDTVKGLSSGKNWKESMRGEGIISEYKENNKTIYAYTGINDGEYDISNFALIGNQCFRILRTTENNSTKLLYFGKYNGTECERENINYGDPFNGGEYYPIEGAKPYYVYDHPSYTYYGYINDDIGWGDVEVPAKTNDDSRAKAMIDKYYENNLLDYTEWFADEIYCNDTTISRDDEWDPEYRPHENTEWRTVNPDLSCAKKDSYTVKNDKGNKKLKYPIATLSVDEYMLTLPKKYTGDPYSDGGWLSDGFFTMTPNGIYNSSGYHAYMFVTYTESSWNGDDKYYVARSTYATYLPVVAVKEEISVKKGTGTREDPYELFKPEQAPIDEPSTDEPEPEVKAEEEEVENPQTGRFNMLWVLPIIAFGLYLAYLQVNKMGLFKNSYKEN